MTAATVTQPLGLWMKPQIAKPLAFGLQDAASQWSVQLFAEKQGFLCFSKLKCMMPFPWPWSDVSENIHNLQLNSPVLAWWTECIWFSLRREAWNDIAKDAKGKLHDHKIIKSPVSSQKHASYEIALREPARGCLHMCHGWCPWTLVATMRGRRMPFYLSPEKRRICWDDQQNWLSNPWSLWETKRCAASFPKHCGASTKLGQTLCLSWRRAKLRQGRPISVKQHKHLGKWVTNVQASTREGNLGIWKLHAPRVAVLNMCPDEKVQASITHLLIRLLLHKPDMEVKHLRNSLMSWNNRFTPQSSQFSNFNSCAQRFNTDVLKTLLEQVVTQRNTTNHLWLNDRCHNVPFDP